MEDPGLHSSILWEITKENNPDTSYLFGTHHMISIKLIDTISILRRSIDKVKEVYLETDIKNMDTQNVMKKTNMKSGEYYFFRTEEDSIIVYDFISEKYEYLLPVLFTYKPLFAAILFDLFEIMKKRKKTSERRISTDEFIYENAILNKQKLSFFETDIEQMSFITDSIPIRSQTNYFVQLIRSKIKGYNLNAGKMDSCYRSFNIECIAGITYMWFGDDPLSRIVLANRNQRWMEKIIPSIENNSAFIAVGALHLAGEEGLIELLRSKGYTLKPVKLN